MGYWGTVTSSVDWCEENYIHSEYIAEFWNTLSSLAMVALGWLGVALHHKSLGWRLSAGYLLIVIVGIGSMLFHATLQFEHQMWDEVPMVWTACYLMWVLLSEHGYQSQYHTIGISLYCALATFVTSQNKGTTQFYMFQSSFGIVMWTDLYFVYKIYYHTQLAHIKQLFHQGVYLLVLAISVWLFDANLCFVYAYLPNPQLHAWWHLLMCSSLHYFFVACGHESVVRRGDRAEIKYFLNMIPYVQQQKNHSE
ncbi:alkaline phytoceramidase family protein [Gilbertella persicaria]|uniref:alkaline phytoceramidase family protein n=1 Tax=Gilbertella persicaria TaxID=101096 RepID=UPI00221FE5D6|nr:alkaline phytoceramidase family protein [Gilbertella persicaria]KAI8058649.1 alkaline phytoceramidase family protein [Gilbertella persicaria]